MWLLSKKALGCFYGCQTDMFALKWYGSVNLLLSFTQPSQNESVTGNFDLPIRVKYLLPIQH